MKINLGKLEEIIQGLRVPDNRQEEIFILTYKLGLEGVLLMHALFQLKDTVDDLTLEERDYLDLGYALGQKDHFDVFDSQISEVNDKPTTTQ